MTTLNNIEQLQRDIEDKQGEITTVQSNIETFEFSCTEEQFNDFLDDAEQSITIWGMEFYPSDILKNCDPVAYRCAKSDYEANFDVSDCEEYQDLQKEIEELESQLDDLQTELDDLESEVNLKSNSLNPSFSGTLTHSGDGNCARRLLRTMGIARVPEAARTCAGTKPCCKAKSNNC